MLLLDEITVDMDVVGRLDLLQFFVQVGPGTQPTCQPGGVLHTLATSDQVASMSSSCETA